MLMGSAEQRSAVIIIKFDSHLNANDAEANTVDLTIFQFRNFVFPSIGFDIWMYFSGNYLFYSDSYFIGGILTSLLSK